jgi:hypothetical protein
MNSTKTAATITQTVSTAESASVSDGCTAILQRVGDSAIGPGPTPSESVPN